MSGNRSKLATGAAVAAAAVGGAAIANAATSNTPTSSPSGSSPTMHQGRHSVGGKTETPLSGDVAAKVKAAALKKVPGTVERVETNVDGNAPYEAHIRKSDGTSVEVQVSKDYTVSAVNQMGGH
jgi:uncharacterized membrane protein YkoI